MQNTSLTIVVNWKRIKFCISPNLNATGVTSLIRRVTVLLVLVLSLKGSILMVLVPSMDLGNSGLGSTSWFKGVRGCAFEVVLVNGGIGRNIFRGQLVDITFGQSSPN